MYHITKKNDLQSQTMQAMYSMVAQELKSVQLVDSHPCDYLNFYCLGNREELPKEASQNSTDSNQVLLDIFSIFTKLLNHD